MKFRFSIADFRFKGRARAAGPAALFIFFTLCLCAFAPLCLSLEPATATITNLREEAESYISQVEYFQSAPLLLTNCIAFAGTTTNSPRQDLSDLTLILSVGTATSNLSYTGTVANATNGVWWARISSVPTNWAQPKLQLKLTNSTEKFIYPLKLLKTKAPL